MFSGSESCGIIGMRGRQTCLMCVHVFALCDICVCMGPAMRFAPTYASHQKRALHRLYFSVFCFILSYLITYRSPRRSEWSSFWSGTRAGGKSRRSGEWAGRSAPEEGVCGRWIVVVCIYQTRWSGGVTTLISHHSTPNPPTYAAAGAYTITLFIHSFIYRCLGVSLLFSWV